MVLYCCWFKGFDLLKSVSSWSHWKHIRMHMVALWQLSSPQFHLRWPFDPPILSAFIFTSLPSSSTPSGPVHYWYQQFLSAALCFGAPPQKHTHRHTHTLCHHHRYHRYHSPIMQEQWLPGYIFPIPSVAGTLASHLLSLLLSPSDSHCFPFPSFGISSSFSLIFMLF